MKKRIKSVIPLKPKTNKKCSLGVHQNIGKRSILKKKSSNRDNNLSQNNILEMNQTIHELKDELEKFRIFANLLPTNNLLLLYWVIPCWTPS